MGRAQKPIDDSGPLGQFARRLRERHDKAKRELGKSLTFHNIAMTAGYSRAALAKAESGDILPTVPLLEALLRTFQATEDELREWRAYREKTAAEVRNLPKQTDSVQSPPPRSAALTSGSGNRKGASLNTEKVWFTPVEAGAATTVLDEDFRAWRSEFPDVYELPDVDENRRKLGNRTDQINHRVGIRLPISPDTASPPRRTESMVNGLDPTNIHTFDQLLEALGELRVAAGSPTYEQMHKASMRMGRGDYPLARSTLSNLFHGKSATPRLETFRSAVATLYEHAERQGLRLAILHHQEVWIEAWRRSHRNRALLSLDAVQTSSDNPGTNLQAVTPAVVEAMATDVAAALLAGIPPTITSQIISALSPEKARAILVALTAHPGAAQPTERNDNDSTCSQRKGRSRFPLFRQRE